MLPKLNPVIIRTFIIALTCIAAAQTALTQSIGRPVNPSGFPAGDTATFRVSVFGNIPPEHIEWKIIYGPEHVAFKDGNNTGPEVKVQGTAPGAFKLEVDVKGWIVTPPHVRPFFTGEVYPSLTIPVAVFIVRTTGGINPALQDSKVEPLLEGASRILWQRAITLVQNGPIRYLDNTAWLNHTDVFNTVNPNLYAMLDSTNSMGQAVELYFVDRLNVSGDHNLAGLYTSKGIALIGSANSRTLAHEIIHNAGAEDIYAQGDNGIPDPDPLAAPVSEAWLPLDWGGGYYNPEQLQFGIISRLLMEGGGYGEVIPRGTVYGWKHSGNGGGANPKELGHSKVGQDFINVNNIKSY